ncbi:DeoR/GlpR family DNA-binding transcription regulator [Agilicoccus flavus]|uniref:DeoR/GlpR family DNA-binding transcription regulator n=1 Tax=Agilicoccus flavus TaxID=2775968 RepID=UPI001CF6E654|nr:DeoR/GlpR family DNA-binding transcription regulator [Agilicoccus flavus]
MYAQERQQALVETAHAQGRLSVTESADAFGVTTETIRRDLAALDARGLLRRVHGGAVPTESLGLVERDVVERAGAHAAEKLRIARAALAHVPTGIGSSLVLDAGTTTAQLAAVLPSDPHLTVLTNSPAAAIALGPGHRGPVHLVGGRLRGRTQATVGAEAVAAFASSRVDVAMLGTNGLTVAHGCSTPHPEEAAVKSAMVRAARRVVVLADSSKIGSEQLRSFARVDEIDVLVTDAGIRDEDRAALLDHGIDVVVA